MPALQDNPGFPYQRPHALAVPQPRTFFGAAFGAFDCTPEGTEHRRLRTQVDRVITPVAGCHHAAVQGKDAVHLQPIERYLQRTPGKGMNVVHQARLRSSLLSEGRLSLCSSIDAAIWNRSCSTSPFRISGFWVCGSTISCKGVPWGATGLASFYNGGQ